MILMIDNYDSFTYNLYQIAAQLYPEIKVVRNDAINIEQIKILAPKAIIISPGPGRPENSGVCISVIKELGMQIPILGICLGLQAMAVAFNSAVILASKPVHGKTSRVQHFGSKIYQHIPAEFQAGRYHSLIVEKKSLTPELIVDAETDDGLIMGLSHQKYPIYGLQFHPESILTPNGATLIKNFIKIAKSYVANSNY